jgi:hypothetical protein
MSTGIESWNMNLLEIGPMYPFPGTEFLWVLLGLATWIIWHIMQFRAENRTYAEEEKKFSDKVELQRAMRTSNAETLIEAMRSHNGKAGNS